MNRDPQGSSERIIRAYRADGPFRNPLTAEELRGWYQKWELDPRTLHPAVFDVESLAHFRQDGVRELFEALAITRDHQVLSLGEGNGAPSRLLAKLVGCRVTGVDLNPSQVAIAQGCAKLHGVEKLVDYIVQDVHALDLSERRFDRFYANETMCHWRDKKLALSRALRFLKPGALLGFNEWLLGDEGDLNEGARKLAEVGALYEPDIWFQIGFDDMRALLSGLGLEVVSAEELTDAVDARVRRRLAGLEAFYATLDEGSRRGIGYFRAMILTHRRYLRYGRFVARLTKAA